MDANEFLEKTTPTAQRSRLAPFWNDITMLREKGCTLKQVCEFLAINGVQISIAGLSMYIKRRGGTTPASTPNANTGHASTAPGAGKSSPVDDLDGLDKKQKRERLADKFLGDEVKPKNSLASRLIKQGKNK